MERSLEISDHEIVAMTMNSHEVVTVIKELVQERNELFGKAPIEHIGKYNDLISLYSDQLIRLNPQNYSHLLQ